MKNKRLSILAVLVMLVAITTYSVSGTYAKYTSEATGTAQASIAKWDIKVGDQAMAKNMTFNLFDTVTETDGNAESDVVNGKIAPGTKGSFTIKLTNSGDVNANYTLNLKKGTSSADIPIKFATGESAPSDETGYAALDTTNGTDFTGTINMANSGTATEETVTIYWIWAYETKAEDNSTTVGDAVDTAAGTAAGTYDLDVTLTATQID